MNTFNLTNLLQNAVSAGLVVLSNVNNIIPTPNPMMQFLKIWTTENIAEDLVNYYNGNGSLILNLDYRNLFLIVLCFHLVLHMQQ